MGLCLGGPRPWSVLRLRGAALPGSGDGGTTSTRCPTCGPRNGRSTIAAPSGEMREDELVASD